jgi:hypothetical protein
MTLNSTGPISLGGTTTGQSIEIELNGNGTTQISLNDTNVRGLAGLSSGQIDFNTFYGKSNATYYIGMYYIFISGNDAPPCGIATDSSNNNYVMFGSGSGAGKFYLLKLNSTGGVTFCTYYNTASAGASEAFSAGFGMFACNGSTLVGIGFSTGGYGTWNTSGTLTYTAQYESTSGSFIPYAIAIDSSSNVYFTGSQEISSGSCSETYYSVGSFTTSGSAHWYKYYNSLQPQGYCLFVDSSGNVLTGGSYGYITEVNSSGSDIVEGYTGGGDSLYSVLAIGKDSSNYIYAAGIENTSGGYAFAYKLNSISSLSTTIWSKKFSSPSGWLGNPPLVPSYFDPATNNTYVLCSVWDGSSHYINFISQINSSGTVVWQRTITITAGAYSGTSYLQNMQMNVTNGQMNILVAYPGQSNARNRCLVLRLPTDGSKTGTYNITAPDTSTNNVTFTYAAASWTVSTPPHSFNNYSLGGLTTPNFTAVTQTFTTSTPTSYTNSSTI